MIYVHDQADLNRVLDALKSIGFEDYDWCEMRRAGSGDVATYGPCPKREFPY